MHLVFELKSVPEVTWHWKWQECRVANPGKRTSTTNPEHIRDPFWAENFHKRFRNLCNQFRILERHFKRGHSLIKIHNEKLMNLTRSLVPNYAPRVRRSMTGFFDGIRQVLNIGSYERQNILAKHITYLRQENRLVYGHMNELEMIVRAEANDTIKLARAVTRQQDALDSLRDTVANLTRMAVTSAKVEWMWTEVSERSAQLTQHTVLRGSLGGQLLHLQGQLLRDRYQGLVAASRGKLSNLLISPEMLTSALNQFEETLHSSYEGGAQFSVKTFDPEYYYQHSTVVVVRVDNIIYVQVPINVFKIHAMFLTFHISSYFLPLDGDKSPNQYTRCTGFSEYVGLSTDNQMYVPLKRDEYLTHCTSPHSSTCLAHKALHNVTHMTCTMAILMKNISAVKEKCQIEYVVLNQLPEPFLVYMGLGKYFVMNYGKEPWKSTCFTEGDSRVYRHTQLQFQLGCNCYLSSTGIQTPSYLDASCSAVSQSDVKYNQYSNLIYLSYLLKTEVSVLQTNLSNDVLEVPEFVALPVPVFAEHEAINHDIVFDLGKLVTKLDKKEVPLISHLDGDVQNLFADNSNNQTGWVVTILSITTSIILGIGLIILCVRGGQIGRTVAILSSAQSVHGHGNMQNTTHREIETILVLQFALCVVALTFIISRVYKWTCGTRLSTVLCKKLSRQSKKLITDIRLEITSLVCTIDFHVVSLNAPSDSIAVNGEMDAMDIHVNKRCVGVNVRLDWNTVTLRQLPFRRDGQAGVQEMSVTLPRNIMCYEIDASQLRRLLNEHCRVNILIGNGTYFTRHCVGYSGLIGFDQTEANMNAIGLARANKNRRLGPIVKYDAFYSQVNEEEADLKTTVTMSADAEPASRRCEESITGASQPNRDLAQQPIPIPRESQLKCINSPDLSIHRPERSRATVVIRTNTDSSAPTKAPTRSHFKCVTAMLK